MNGVFILGSTGKAGQLLVEGLVPDRKVVVMHRNADRVGEFEAMGATVIRGDAMDRDAMFAAARQAAKTCDTLVSFLGGLPFSEPETWPDYTGNVNAIDAAIEAGLRRFIFVTSIGTGRSIAWVPENSAFLLPLLELKTRAEAYLCDTDLDWTIIKPGGLIDKFDETYTIDDDKLLVTENPAVRGVVTRKMLAEVVMKTITSPVSTAGRELHVVADQIVVLEGDTQAFEFSA